MQQLRSIDQANRLVGNKNGKQKNVTLLTFKDNKHLEACSGQTFQSDLYIIKVAKKQLLFIRPGNVILINDKQGDTLPFKVLVFHPNLLRKSAIIRQLNEYEFFSPKFENGINISPGEFKTISTIFNLIDTEISKEGDALTEQLIVSQIFLLFDYCKRYFGTSVSKKESLNGHVIGKFNSLLKAYYNSKKPQLEGVLTVAYCAEALNISANYLGDLLKRETGLNARQQIQEFVINKAKSELLQTNKPIGEISLILGFNYQQHFSKFFKSQTGITPSSFRTINEGRIN